LRPERPRTRSQGPSEWRIEYSFGTSRKKWEQEAVGYLEIPDIGVTERAELTAVTGVEAKIVREIVVQTEINLLGVGTRIDVVG
jgi:hypothetical protein